MAYRYMKDSDWKNFKNFKKSEFKCKCGNKYCNGYPNEIAYSLVEMLQKCRDYYKKPITITSGLRCKEHNKKVGGVSNSKHMTGQAVDFKFSGMNKSDVIKWLKKQDNYNYAYTNETNMKNAVHIDTKLTKEVEPSVNYEELYKNTQVQLDNANLKIKQLETNIEELNQNNINLQNELEYQKKAIKFTYKATNDGKYKIFLYKDETLEVK